MIEKPITMYEGGERKKEMAIRVAISDKVFSPKVILAMIAESPEKKNWVEDFVANKDYPILSISDALEELGEALGPFTRDIKIALIRRHDCPKSLAEKWAKEVFELRDEKKK